MKINNKRKEKKQKMKKIVVATNNKGKIKEIKEILKEYDIKRHKL